MVSESLDTEIYTKNMLSGQIPPNRLLGSELLLFLRKIRFSEKKFSASTSVSNIKYHYPKLQNNDLFYLFNYQLNNALTHYFTKSKLQKVT